MNIERAMDKPLSRALFAVFLIACFVLAPVAVRAAATDRVIGTVVHVSTTDVEVKAAATGKIHKFLLVPRFKRVFSKDGKTTLQMSALKPGTPVTVYYDRHLLGIAHADRILINGSVRGVNG
jgi:hypothetical protein